MEDDAPVIYGLEFQVWLWQHPIYTAISLYISKSYSYYACKHDQFTSTVFDLMSLMGFVPICCQLKMFMLTKSCVLTRTYTYILQARALTPQTGETDAIRFLVGTQSLKFDNQVWKNRRQEKCTLFYWCFWVFTCSRTLKYNLGSVVFFCFFCASLMFVVLLSVI